jgi:hypothetical protein
MSIQQNFPAISPSLSLNFARSKTLDPRITFTRTSSATRVNGQGLIEVIPANSARFDHSYDPVSGTVRSLGLLVEEARTNSIRNNTGVGAVVGTPGTPPTNWSIGTNNSGLVREIIGTGVENGISYIDVKFSGTTSNNSEFFISPEPGIAAIASNGQTWTGTFFVRLIDGSISNIVSARVVTRGVNSSGSQLTISTGVDVKSLLNNTSFASNRFNAIVTTSNDTTAAVQTYFACVHNSGVAINITLRIGLPQLELGAFPTSVIPTSGSTVTRTADNVSMVGENFSSWYNSSEGTVYAEANPGSFVAQRVVCDLGANALHRITLLKGTNGNAFWFVNNGNNTQASLQFSPWNTTGKLSGAYKLNDFASSFNGSTVLTDDSGLLPENVNKMDIGKRADGSNYLNGTIRNITYYPKRLPNAFLQNLTK